MKLVSVATSFKLGLSAFALTINSARHTVDEASGSVDVSYAALQAHRIVNVALHWEYSPDIIFIFSHGRKDIYHV
jgi:hypothetical protein